MASRFLDTAVGVFGIIHGLGPGERTASGLESRGGLSGRRSSNRSLGSLRETILHGCGLSLIRRRMDFHDMTVGRSRSGRKFGVGCDTAESVSTASRTCRDRRKHGRCNFDCR